MDTRLCSRSIIRSLCRVSGFTSKPCITVEPQTCLMDEVMSISVTGLEPCHRISILSTVKDRSKEFQAYGHFVADYEGRVHLNTQPSVGGTYTGVEPMGLFWSIRPAAGQRRGSRFAKKDVTTPAEYRLAVYNDHLVDKSFSTSLPLQETLINRWYMREEDVDRIKVGSGRFRGVIFKPKGPGPFPGVIDMFGGAGGIIEYRAALLASRGFAALALPYFDYEDMDISYSNLEFEYFEEAAEYLSSLPFVSSGGIGILGLSYGGSIGLEMAARIPKIKAVVALSCMPCLVANVTYKGHSVSSVYQINATEGYMGDHGFIFKGKEIILKLPLERIIDDQDTNAQLLFIAGEDDQSVPAVEGARLLIQKLHSYGKTNFELITYPGAGHLLEPPYQSAERGIYNVPLRMILDFGGEMKQHAHACEDAWGRTLSFLRQHLIPNNKETPTKQSLDNAAGVLSKL